MASLNGQLISGTYPALIKFSDNNALSATLRPLSDGIGAELPVEVSTSTFSVTGTLNVTTGQVTGLYVADLEDGNTLATIASVTLITDDLQAQIDSNDTDITNLQAADVTLQTNIGNEESARITADANLQTQIDNLAGGSGSVISIDGVEGVVDLVEGNSIDITPNTITGQITIAVDSALSNQVSTNQTNISTNTSAITDLENGVGNVTSFNTLTGDVTISAGTNITFNTVGNDIEISSSGGGGGSDSFNTFTVPTQPDVVAASGNDTMNFVDGDGISMTTNNTTKTITFEVDGLGSTTLTEDYIWVGDSNGVPQEVAVSTLGGVTINNNVNDYLLTATGTANTINGESKLRFDAVNQTLTIESSNSTNGLTLDGGVFGAANPKISATGFTNIHMDKNLVLENQTKIAFDTDATNTYIAADLTTPENLTINADGYVDVYIADGFRVWENNASPAPMFKVEKSGDFPRVGIGVNVTTTDSELYVDGIVEAEEFLYDYNNAQLTYQGETIRLGTTSTTAGQLYAWSGTNWVLADADSENTARALLGIAIANTSDKGMLVNGWYKTGTTYSNCQLYMSATAGGFTTTPPSSTGQFVRIVGHGINSTTIRFNPSNEYYTVE